MTVAGCTKGLGHSPAVVESPTATGVTSFREGQVVVGHVHDTPRLSCFTFDRHEVCRAFSRALANAGNNIAARMAMMAMTTNNSMSVDPQRIC
jgi:hypothetical protein